MASKSTTAFVIFIGVALLVFFLARKKQIRFWGAVVLALITAGLIIQIFYPKAMLDPRFLAIAFASSFIFLIYIVAAALKDKEPPRKPSYIKY